MPNYNRNVQLTFKRNLKLENFILYTEYSHYFNRRIDTLTKQALKDAIQYVVDNGKYQPFESDHKKHCLVGTTKGQFNHRTGKLDFTISTMEGEISKTIEHKFIVKIFSSVEMGDFEEDITESREDVFTIDHVWELSEGAEEIDL